MRRLRRVLVCVLRCAACVAALIGHLAASVGFPALVPFLHSQSQPQQAGPKVRPCGCVVESESEGCCCSNGCCSGKAHAPASTEDGSAEWLIGDLVRHCRGLSPDWATPCPALPLPPTVAVECDESPAGWLCLVPQRPDSLLLSPPAPPPRG